MLCRWVVQLLRSELPSRARWIASRSTCVCLAFKVVAPLVTYRATQFLDLGRLINVVTVDTPRIFDCGVRVMLRSAATCSAQPRASAREAGSFPRSQALAYACPVPYLLRPHGSGSAATSAPRLTTLPHHYHAYAHRRFTTSVYQYDFYTDRHSALPLLGESLYWSIVLHLGRIERIEILVTNLTT